MITDKDIKRLKNVFATKEDLNNLKREFIAKFVTKDEFSSGFNKLLKNIDHLSQDVVSILNIVGDISQKFEVRIKASEDILDDHEHRLDRLEDKVLN